ncbi:MAG: RluA family pseudouridine synthase [Deltaproteobacteria bacterium]|nr:RluA family pseudouridine synthase [Deltaproteobacteria bacterium]
MAPGRRLVHELGPADSGADLSEIVAALLARAGADETAAAAIARGAVFVDRARAARPDQRPTAGQVVSVTLSCGGPPELELIAEDEHVLVLAKPAGISSVADLSDRSGSLLGIAEARWGAGLHLLGRLDREVTGVVVALRTASARRRAALLRRAGRIEREYVAVVAPAPAWQERDLDLPIGRHPTDPRLRAAGGREAVPALTRVRVVAERPLEGREGPALVEARPVTGRTHQIRVHLSHAGHPIAGDRAYGGPRRLTRADGEVLACPRVLLHAARLRMPHPGGSGMLEAEAPWPDDLRRIVAALESRR